jgi:hypothetical protein
MSAEGVIQRGSLVSEHKFYDAYRTVVTQGNSPQKGVLLRRGDAPFLNVAVAKVLVKIENYSTLGVV